LLASDAVGRQSEGGVYTDGDRRHAERALDGGGVSRRSFRLDAHVVVRSIRLLARPVPRGRKTPTGPGGVAFRLIDNAAHRLTIDGGLGYQHESRVAVESEKTAIAT